MLSRFNSWANRNAGTWGCIQVIVSFALPPLARPAWNAVDAMSVPDWAAPWTVALPGLMVSLLVLRQVSKRATADSAAAVTQERMDATRVIVQTATLAKRQGGWELELTLAFVGRMDYSNWTLDSATVFVGDGGDWREETKARDGSPMRRYCAVPDAVAKRLDVPTQRTVRLIAGDTAFVTVGGVGRKTLESPFVVAVQPLPSAQPTIANAIPDVSVPGDDADGGESF